MVSGTTVKTRLKYQIDIVTTKKFDVDRIIATMVEKLRSTIQTEKIPDPIMIGIHTGGVWIAERLHQALGLQEPLGTLDISFYRDDFTRVGVNPQVKPSRLPLKVDNRHIILVDDVLFTGRTVRAAMDALMAITSKLKAMKASAPPCLLEKEKRGRSSHFPEKIIARRAVAILASKIAI